MFGKLLLDWTFKNPQPSAEGWIGLIVIIVVGIFALRIIMLARRATG